MRTTFHAPVPIVALTVLLLASCASTAPTARVSDDVYQRPDGRALAGGTSTAPAGTGQDEYYDPATASSLTERSYYDMAYNDPYYYNYGRFGFGATMGTWGSGWNMNYGWGTPGWGMNGWNMSMGMGYGMGWGWNDPFYRPMGAWGWNDPFYNPYWGWGGVGPYYGWGGSCWGCYQPIVYCGNTSYQHRPGLMGGAGAPGATGQQRQGRDPAGLIAPPRQSTSDPRWGVGRSVPTNSSRPSMERNSGSRSMPSTSPSRRGGAPSVQPSPGRMNGGSRPSMGGGGSRPSMGGRPR